jgi:hypothetical protein
MVHRALLPFGLPSQGVAFDRTWAIAPSATSQCQTMSPEYCPLGGRRGVASRNGGDPATSGAVIDAVVCGRLLRPEQFSRQQPGRR